MGAPHGSSSATWESLGACAFTPERQERFAELTGDWNPVHLDAAAARENALEAPIAHGLHLVLMALDRHLATAPPFARLHAIFRKPVMAGETISIVRRKLAGGWELQGEIDGAPLFEVRLEDGEAASSGGRKMPPPGEPAAPARTAPSEPNLAPGAEAGVSGALPFTPALSALASDFPTLSKACGGSAVASMALISTVVGMIWPGKRSIIGEVVITMGGEADMSEALRYAVEELHPAMPITRLALTAPDFTGSALAFIRPETVRQPSVKSLIAAVEPGEFAAERALVVGGARGVGEVAAKLIAAGGGRPTITFHSESGRARAEAIVEELRTAGLHGEAARLDVAAPADLDALDLETVTSLLYFPSPPIFRRRHKPFHSEHLSEFMAIYVDALDRVVRTVRARSVADPLRVFLPSSVALDTFYAGMLEYTVAKAAAETLARYLEKELPRTRFVIGRLPRIATDQTNSIFGPPATDAIEAMLPWLRQLTADPKS